MKENFKQIVSEEGIELFSGPAVYLSDPVLSIFAHVLGLSFLRVVDICYLTYVNLPVVIC